LGSTAVGLSGKKIGPEVDKIEGRPKTPGKKRNLTVREKRRGKKKGGCKSRDAAEQSLGLGGLPNEKERLG